MIVVARTPQQADILATFLQLHAGVHRSPELVMIGWASDAKNQIDMVVGLDTFIGKTCHIHVAMRAGFNYTPKEMLQTVFDFAFNVAKREMLIGIVNSLHERTLKYDLHLGFKEQHRLPKMHDNDGDIVVLSMTRDDCKYLEMKEAA